MSINSIPHKVHYCWFGGGDKPPLVGKCMRSWQRYLPDFEFIEWNELNSPMLEPFVKAAYEQSRWSTVANFVRLYALALQGGVYLDTDVEVLRTFDYLIDEKCFLGFNQRRPGLSKHWVNNAVIGSVISHPFIMEALGRLQDSDAKARYGGLAASGPGLLTELLLERGLVKYGFQEIDGIRLYPTEFFYPYPWWADFHPSRVTKNTFAIHYWMKSHVVCDTRSRRTKLKARAYNLTSKLLGFAKPMPRLYTAIDRASSWFS